MHLIANYSKLLLSICVNAQSTKKKKEKASKEKVQRESHYKSSYSIPLKQWQVMHLWFQKGKFPTRFGRKPRIPKITSGKTRCIEWKFFLLHLLVPLLYACNVSKAFLLPMAKIVDCLRFCLDKSATSKESIEKVKIDLKNAMTLLENYIVGNDINKMDYCTSNTHFLFHHFVDCFLNHGPPVTYAQWSLEGMLYFLRNQVHSKSLPERQLANTLKLHMQLNLLHTIPGYTALEKQYLGSGKMLGEGSVNLELHFSGKFSWKPTKEARDALHSFLVTQNEDCYVDAAKTQMAPNPWKSQFSSADLVHLHLLLTTDALNNMNLVCYKRMFYRGQTYNSKSFMMDKAGTRYRDNSIVCTRMGIDKSPQQIETEIIDQRYYHQIEHYFELGIGSQTVYFALGTELLVQRDDYRKSLDIIGILY